MADYLTEFAPPTTSAVSIPSAPPDPSAMIVPYANPAPRAVSVAGALPDPDEPTPALKTDAPPEVQNSTFGDGIMQRLNSEPSDHAFDDAMSINKPSLAWALKAFKGVNPDVAAQVDNLAKHFGIPYSAANSGKEALETKKLADDTFASLTATDDKGQFLYPNTVNWLNRDPANLAKSKDDVTNLSAIEETVKAQQQAGEPSWLQTLRSGEAGAEKVVGSFFTVPGVVAKIVQGSLSQPGAAGLSGGGGIGGQPYFDSPFNGAFGSPDSEMPEWLKTWFGASTAMERQANTYSGSTTQGDSLGAEVSKGNAAGIVQQGAINLFSFVPTIAASILDPAIGLIQGAGSSSAQQYQNDLDSGKTPLQASQDAVLNAGVNAVGMKTFGTIGQLERMKALFSKPLANETTSQLWGRVVRQSAISGTQGYATQATMQVGDDAADYATGNKAAFDNEWQKIVTSGILGFIADGTMVAPAGAFEGLRQIRDHEKGSSAWSKLTNSAQQSKLLQRDPAALADVITQNLTSAGKPTTVGVDADKLTTFFQGRPSDDLNKFASDMGMKPEDIANAATTGGSVDIPIGPYQAKYIGTDLDKAINQDIRFTPGGLSANELQDQIAHVKQLGEAITAELAKTGTDEAPLPEQIKTMRDTLMAATKDGGMGYSQDQADSQLAVLLAGIKHTVAQPGETTSQAVTRLGLGLKVGGEAPAENPKARGQISLGDGKTTIHLFKNADLSTFAHETGHLFLDQRQKLIDQGLASPQAILDHQTLLNHVGVKTGEKASTDQTEKLVSSFESYLRDGKAPSIELSGPFARFRSWLTSIYRSVTALGVNPTDEVKQVFDRMLASEDDIAHAQEYYSRTGEVLDLIKADDADKQAVRVKLAKVQQTELEQQTRAYLKSYLEAVGGRSAIRTSAKEAVEAQPIYKALETAKDGKIDEQSLREALGTKGFNEFTDKFPNLVKKNGEHTLETLALQHGFESPETLADNFMAAVPKAEAITNYTQRLVAEKEQQIRDEIVKRGATPADGVMHTEGSLAYLIAETNLMAKQFEKGKSVRIDAPAYRDAAKQAIADMPVKKAVRYSDFAKTEARLAKRVLDLAKRGQWEDSAPDKDGKVSDGALTTRRKQIAQHAMVQEAIKVRDGRNEIVRRFSPSKLEAKLKNVENEYVDPVRQILSTYGLSDVRPETPYDLNQLDDVDRVLFSQLPSWLLRGENAGDYRNLTWSQLQDVDNAARSVLAFGNDQRKSDLAMEEKTIGEIVDKSVAAINALPERNVRQLGGNFIGNAYTASLQKLDWLKSHVTKAQFLFKILDNFSEERRGHAGIMSKLFHGMSGAEHDQSEAQRAVYENAKPHLRVLADATNQMRKEKGQYFSIPGVEKPAIYNEKGRANWSPEELVSYMLNTGAEGNLAALKNAFGHGPAEIQRVASHFTAEELHAVDGLRDAIGTMFDGLNETNFKLYNRNVEKVEAVPSTFTSKDGRQVDLKGGYWPLVFDHEINRLQGQHSEEDVLQGQIKAFLRTAKPEDGMTKSRVKGHSLAPRLDMGVFADHVDDTTRFVHMAPLLRDMDRVMQNPKWRDAVVNKVGANEYDQTRKWLEAQANPGRKQTTDLMRGVDKVADYARSAATASALGLNFVAGLKWRTSMLNSVVALGGWRHIANGYAGLGTRGLGTSTLGLSNTETWKTIVSKSKLLGPREAKGIRDLRDDVEKLKWNQPEFSIPGTNKTFTGNDLKHAMYEWSKMNDRAVVAPVWVGAYMKYHNEMGEPGMMDGARDKAAVDYADGIIQTSQPTSLNVDLNSFQRNQTAFIKLYTMFMSYPYTIVNRFAYMAKALQAGAITKQEYTSHFIHEVLLEPFARTGIAYAALGKAIPFAALALAPMSNMVAGIPGLSTLFNVGQSAFNPDELSPAFDVLRKAENVAKDAITNKDIVKLGWDIARLTTYVTRTPLLNVVKTWLDVSAEANGTKNQYK